MQNNIVEFKNIPELQGLDSVLVTDLRNTFEPLFKAAQEWETIVKDIVVVDVNDKDMMLKARDARLKLKEIRVNVEKTRKGLKENLVLKSKAIDGLANIIKSYIVPLEDKLEEQEKFIELQEEKRLNELFETRNKEISVYLPEASAVYDIKHMTEEVYQILLKNMKELYEIKQEKIKKEEEEKIRQQEEERKEQIRIKEENERLKIEQEENNKKINRLVSIGLVFDGITFKFDELEISFDLVKESKDFEKMFSELEIEMKSRLEEKRIQIEKAEQERIANEKEQQRIKAEEDKRLKDLEKAKIKAEETLKRKKDEEERVKKENIAKEKAMRLAPDKDKLKALAAVLLDIKYPELKSEESKEILSNVKVLIQKVNVYIVENIEKI
jgi:trichohyalin